MLRIQYLTLLHIPRKIFFIRFHMLINDFEVLYNLVNFEAEMARIKLNADLFFVLIPKRISV